MIGIQDEANEGSRRSTGARTRVPPLPRPSRGALSSPIREVLSDGHMRLHKGTGRYESRKKNWSGLEAKLSSHVLHRSVSQLRRGQEERASFVWSFEMVGHLLAGLAGCGFRVYACERVLDGAKGKRCLWDACESRSTPRAGRSSFTAKTALDMLVRLKCLFGLPGLRFENPPLTNWTPIRTLR